MMKRFIDTNVFLRYLTADDASMYGRCRELFKRTSDGREILVTSALVIAEVIWTLLSYYKVPKEEVVEKVSIIVDMPNLEVENYNILMEALLLYGRRNVDFIDAYNATYMRHRRIEQIYSYDRDFDRMDVVKRLTP